MEEDELHEFAVLWENTGYDDNGQPTVAESPEEIPCRWVEKLDQAVDKDGNLVATLIDVVVDRAITPGSILWEGQLSCLPSSPTDLKLVVGSVKTPDIKGRNKRRVLKLMRYGDSLPTQQD